MSVLKKYRTSNSTMFLKVCEDGDEAAKAAEAEKALQIKIDSAVAAATAGLKTKNDELLGKLAKASERAKTFDGLDPVELKALKDRLDQDDDAKLLAEGKKNQVIEKYTERMRAAHEDALKAERERTAAEARRADSFRGAVLDGKILAVTAGLHKGAVEDALLYGRQSFTLDADGNAVKLDSEGRPELGKDGKTPFSPAEWIDQMKELKPHWFPMSTTGSGGSNTRDASGTGKSIKRADFERLSPSEQGSTVRGGVQVID